MIVKNESKIMERCLDQAKKIIDFVSICDTGSTDNTPEVIEKWCVKNNIPGKVHHEPFKNFGYNRTLSVKMAKKSFPQADYLLLIDADMIIEIADDFDKRMLVADKYDIEQYSDDQTYDNCRLAGTRFEWNCVGVTHEFWRADGIQIDAKLTKIRIHDKGDGGCKSDKFQRDKRLLLGGIADPKTPDDLRSRYRFYLGNTLRDLGENEESIKWYQARIADGGWQEEVFYAKYQIGVVYERMAWEIKDAIDASKKKVLNEHDIKIVQAGNPMLKDEEELNEDAKKLYDKAFESYMDSWKYRPTRAEGLYGACKLHRTLSQTKEAFKLAVFGRDIPYPKDDRLFIDHNVYKYLFDFEMSIVAAYIPGQKEQGKEALRRLLLRDDLPNDIAWACKHNSKFYELV